MNTRWHSLGAAEKLHYLAEYGRLTDELANLRMARDEAAQIADADEK